MNTDVNCAPREGKDFKDYVFDDSLSITDQRQRELLELVEGFLFVDCYCVALDIERYARELDIPCSNKDAQLAVRLLIDAVCREKDGLSA